MPGTEDLQAFVEEALLEYDPDIDLSEGSPAQIEVIDPIVNRFTPDPFEVDVPTYIRTRIQQEYPKLNAEEGDALADLLIKPMEALLDPIIREVEFLRKNKSLNNPDLLAPDEADALMGNFFVSRTRGEISVGSIRIYFNAPTAISLSLSNEAATSDGLKFIPATTQEISAEDMLFNQDGTLFYMDAAYEAEKEGDEYNIDANEITTIANIPASVRVTNLARFRDGAPEESTLQFIERGESSLTERSLVVPRGVIARLFDQFGDLVHLQTVGFNDPEMNRDVIKGGNLGDIVIYANDGQTSDDGNGDGYTNLFESPAGGFISTLGSVGETESYVLTVAGVDHDIVEVVSDEVVKVVGEDGAAATLPDTLSGAEFYIRKRLLTLSDIPGGIIDPDGINGTVDIVNNEIHVGGSSDFHVRGTSLDDEELVLEAVSDELPLTTGTGLRTLVVGMPSDVVTDPTLVGTDFETLGVKTGMTLVIETDAGNAGSYQIIGVGVSGTKSLQVEPAPSSTVIDQKYKIVNEIDINLNEPKTIRGFGSDLKTILGNTQVSTVAEVDFDQLGTEVDDTLRIPEPSLNAGDFAVNAITGTGNKILTVGSQMKKTSSSDTWSLFKLGAGIEPPLVRVTSVGLLDSSKQPTGDTIPYADPVDIQTSAFSNIGVGEKKTVSDAVLGILGTVDLSVAPTAVNGTFIRISINGSSQDISFSGVLTEQDIVDQINVALTSHNVADLHEVEGELRLSLRSRNNWIQVSTAGTANTALGLSTAYIEDNRQVVSSSVLDWTASSLSIEAVKDSVYVLTGDNVEFWYLHEVVADRLLISRVDSDGKAVFPLTDDRTTVRIGSRSFGTVRCYFLEPTSFEVRGSYRRAVTKTSVGSPNLIYGTISKDEDPRTEFDLDVFGDGSAYYRYFPDPALEHTLLPVTDEDVPDNLYIATAGDTFAESDKTPGVGPGELSRSDAIDFLLREVLPGDVVEVTHHPLEGTVDMRPSPTGIPVYSTDIQAHTMIFSLENGPDKTVTFSSDVTTPEKLVAEINAQLGVTIAYVETASTGEKYLRLEADFDFILRTTGTVMTPNDYLGMQSVAGTNDAPAKGKYVVSSVGQISGATSNHMRLTFSSKIDDPAWTGFVTSELGPAQHFKIHRPGVQRISATDMEQNTEGSLYYADVELVSFGPGNEFNIGADIQLSASQYKSDGYRLYNNDHNLTFSIYETVMMQLSRRFLTPGSTDSPENMTLISRQNLQVNYERSALVEQIQGFATSDLERVLNANLLVRHLTPHYVQFSLTWQGGSTTSIIEEDIEDLIESLLPDDELEAAAVSSIPLRRGASSVEQPLTLLGIVHDTDRTVRIVRSQDAISRGRLATFITDDLTLTRQEDT